MSDHCMLQSMLGVYKTRSIRVEDSAGPSAETRLSVWCSVGSPHPCGLSGQKCVVEGDPPVINGDCLLTEDAEIASDDACFSPQEHDEHYSHALPASTGTTSFTYHCHNHEHLPLVQMLFVFYEGSLWVDHGIGDDLLL